MCLWNKMFLFGNVVILYAQLQRSWFVLLNSNVIDFFYEVSFRIFTVRYNNYVHFQTFYLLRFILTYDLFTRIRFIWTYKHDMNRIIAGNRIIDMKEAIYNSHYVHCSGKRKFFHITNTEHMQNNALDIGTALFLPPYRFLLVPCLPQNRRFWSDRYIV